MKARTPNQRKAYAALQKRIKGYASQINTIYEALNRDASHIALNTDYNPDSDKLFSFDDYPTAKRAFDTLQKQYVSDMTAVIYASTSKEWNESNLAQSLLARRVLTAYKFGEDKERYYETNSDALKAFQQRTIKGMNLSRRVWNLSEQYKQELELSLSVGLQRGMSANELARNVQKYLNEPDKLFRRVRDEYGNLVLSKAAKAYHPGRGVYRSSFRNARRLTASETNMAYRTAEQLRWKQMDFIVGYEVKTSQSNHEVTDICDELAGKYPKDFQWTGWHPHCYSDDSEVLTNHGWKLFKDVEADDLILSLNPQTRNVEWVKHVAQQCYDYNGEMVYFHNRSLDCLVTPEHRMVYLSKHDGEIKYCMADEFTQSKGAFYRGCLYSAQNVDKIQIGDLYLDADLFFEFMGYWLADGSATRKSFVSIAQLATDKNIENIRGCVAGMGFKVHDSKNNVCFNSKAMKEYLSQFGHAADKFVPNIIKQASCRQIRIFLNAFVSCDGHVRTPHPFIGNRGGLCMSARDERVYYTSSKQLAADLGELILKVGHRPSYSINSTKGTVTHFRNGDYAANYDSYSVRETYAPTATVFTKERVNYVGKVYDLTLERNHIMYIRRNGKCFWGSNCRCYAIPIIKTDAEYLADAPSASEVKDVPDNFKQWVEDNEERIATMRQRGTEPYFLRDNTAKVDGILAVGDKPTPLEIAAQRHAARTPEQIADLQRWSNNHTEYFRLKADKNYKNVEFNPANGGLRATHIKHITHSSKKEETFFGGKTSSDLELLCQQELFNSGHSCILLQEGIKQTNGNIQTALDALIDGAVMDIRSITQNKEHYGSAIKTKIKQLRNYNANATPHATGICLYFFDSNMYSHRCIQRGIEWICKNYPKDMYDELEVIHIVIKGKGLHSIRMADTR
jgi:intein/homing endonuclease